MNWLKRYRASVNLSQQQVADTLGISKSLVCLIESGKRKPGPSLLPVIRDELGIAPEVVRPDLVKPFRALAKRKG